jgi:pimeloyl-ACP methyl ester carboxylesterase
VRAGCLICEQLVVAIAQRRKWRKVEDKKMLKTNNRKNVAAMAGLFAVALSGVFSRALAAPAAGAAALASALSSSQPQAPQDTAVRPFRISVPQSDLDELRKRIVATRWPGKETAADGSQGVPLTTMQGLVRYWATDYDWRKAEATLNAIPQFVTNIDGLDIHFIHVRSRHPHALPVIITHGWPGSVIEQLKIIGPLTEPTAHGGRAEEAFDVVIPSLPGYGFSSKPATAEWGPEKIARAWGELMKRLGYSHYVAQGGDWGSAISSEMARLAPPGLAGIHINLAPVVPPEVVAVLPVGGPPPAGMSDRERATFDVLVASAKMGSSAYVTMMSTRPQTIGYSISDSPVGLAAWMLVHPGFAKWSYGADPAKLPTKDDVLDDITLYWLTNSGASASRLYWENHGRPILAASTWKTTEISMPVAITVFGEDAYRPPESWARRAYPSLMYFHETDKGGHFAAWEQPELFAAELRAAFKTLRNAQ